MKTMSRHEFLVLTQTYFADENIQVEPGSEVTIEQAYESVRGALAREQGVSVPSEELRFTSQPQEGDFDMGRLEYK